MEQKGDDFADKFGRWVYPNEIIIEDLEEQDLMIIGSKMEKIGGYYVEYWKAPGQQSGHLHIKNIMLPEKIDIDLINKYKELIIKKYVREELWTKLDWNFVKQKRHRIAEENKEHYKGYGVKSLLQTYGQEKENPFEEKVFEQAKVELQEAPRTNVDIKDWSWVVDQAVKNWKEGNRQNNSLCLAGYLRKNKGLGIETVKAIITEICSKANDDELPMRLKAVDETFKKDEKQVKGYTGLGFLDEKEEQKVSFEIYTDSDLRNFTPEPVSWLIENQIPKSEIGLLVGKRGVRKTFTAIRQAISIASGRDFLGDSVPSKKRVLIIDEESGKNEIAKRTKLLKEGAGVTEDLDIHFLSFENIKLDDVLAPKYKAFEELIENIKPDLIIVDCLQRILSLEVDRDNQGISAFFTGVARSITKRIGCSWLFIHHMRKSNPQNKPDDPLDEVRGGSELVNYCRFVLMCSEPRKKCKDDKTLIVFEVLKMSNSQIPPSKVIEFKSCGEFITMNNIGSPDEILNTEAKIGEAIKNYILENELTGEFRTGDILGNAKKIGFKKSSLNMGLRWLEENNILVKEKRGTWRLSSDEDICENDL